ncbi:MAG: DUF1919 domain-containing protein [Clostridia bacterium]|nr:DUF1919 domain-containing protein [Clostridia bacterium]
MSIIGKIIDGHIEKRRLKIHRAFRKKLKNETPSIIANNCFGTMIYYHLGLRYMSPTINLFIKKDEYLTFVSNLREYLDAEMTEVTDTDNKYPVGELICDGKAVRIYGMHYKSFDELKEKWDSRKRRIDYNNFFVVMTTLAFTKDDAEVFDKLPYENKLVVTGRSECDRPYITFHKVLKDESYDIGRFVQYDSRFSIKKPMDDIDYVGFLNGKND